MEREVIREGPWRVSPGLGVGGLRGRWGGDCSLQLGVPPLILPSTPASDLACLKPSELNWLVLGLGVEVPAIPTEGGGQMSASSGKT